jgi:hypothetical protein
MQNRLLSILLSAAFSVATLAAPAQEFLCHKAIKKDDKSCKKTCKVRKKMFHDSPYKAIKKDYKADKKACKAEVNEHFHHMSNHIGYAD